MLNVSAQTQRHNIKMMNIIQPEVSFHSVFPL